MFLEYYGLRDQPFGVTPDPRYLYFSATHREALGSLFYGIETGCGFLALIAPPGMGKTTLLTHLLERLRSSAQTAFLFHTQCDARDFLCLLLTDLGVEVGDQNLARMYESLHSVLLRNARIGRQFVLVIDEAQNLPDPVLETVRLLSDFETPQNKLMQIVLCGQTQLADRLAKPGLTQLRQRISIVSKLQALSSVETMMYVDYRLMVAGHAGKSLFTYDAVTQIAARSGGIPRNINNICFNALTLGYAKRQRQIDASIVGEVLADLDLDLLSSNVQSPVAALSDPMDSFEGPLPTDEPTYRKFHAAIRSAWAKDPGSKLGTARLETGPQLLRSAGERGLVDPAFEKEQTPAVAASSAEPRSRFVEPKRYELRELINQHQAPPPVNSISSALSALPIATPSENHEIRDERQAAGAIHAESKVPPIVVPPKTVSRMVVSADKNIAAPPVAETQADQPGLTEVLASFFGSAWTFKAFEAPPLPMREGSNAPTAEAGD